MEMEVVLLLHRVYGSFDIGPVYHEAHYAGPSTEFRPTAGVRFEQIPTPAPQNPGLASASVRRFHCDPRSWPLSGFYSVVLVQCPPPLLLTSHFQP